MNEIWIFITGVLVLLAAPGPTNTLLAVAGAERGVLGSLPMLIAELIGYSLAVWCIHFLLQPLLAHFPNSSMFFKLTFAAYASYLAVRLWRISAANSTSRPPITFGSMFLVTLLNPKAFGFAFVLIPFESPYASLYFLTFLAMIAITGTGWILAGALAIRFGGQKSQKIVGRTGSVVMGLFAVFILLTAIYGQN